MTTDTLPLDDRDTCAELFKLAVQLDEYLRQIRAHLLSPKFGPQTDGSRGDWIATADVLRRIETLLTILEN